MSSRDDIVAASARLGPFVAVGVHEGPRPEGDGWLPGRAMAERATLERRVERTRAALAARQPPGAPPVDTRTAASTAHLGLAARLVAAEIGLRVLGLTVAGAGDEEPWWRDDIGGPLPLSVALADCVAADGEPACSDLVVRLAEAVSAWVGPRVAWGNVASGVNGAARMIGAADPSAARRATEIADALLRDDRLGGGAMRSGPDFRRDSCCLIYKVAGTREAVCGDCVLRQD